MKTLGIIRALGIALLALSAAMTGAAMAARLSDRVAGAEAAILLTAYLRGQLRYLSPPVRELCSSAASQGSLSALPFLPLCRDRLIAGESFPSAWRGALREAPGSLGEEELSILAELGDGLGSSDLESQLALLGGMDARLQPLLAGARARRAERRRLYPTLGALSGAAIAILFI